MTCMRGMVTQKLYKGKQNVFPDSGVIKLCGVRGNYEADPLKIEVPS